MDKFFIDNFDFFDKKVVIRVDWNIPAKDNIILDDYRIVSSLPSILRILSNEPKYIVIISHFGRPEGKDIKYSWINFITKIQDYFNIPIGLLPDGLSNKSLNILNENKFKIYLLENIRFHMEETEYLKLNKNDTHINEPINVIQKLGDIFVNDAFGCMHRNHLSICGIKTKEKAYGYLVHNELNALKVLLNNTENKKILAIIGGAKVNDKLPLLEQLSLKVHSIYIAGGNINGILKDDNMALFIDKIKGFNKANIYLTQDGISSTSLIKNEQPNYYKCSELPDDEYFYDIGEESLNQLNKLINFHDIIFWNGTLGVVENNYYEKGTYKLLEILKNSKKQVFIGGGDTAGYVNKNHYEFDFISTGGGAMIDYISNGTLAGLDYFTD